MFRDSYQTGRLRLRHLREVTEARREEMEAMRPRFDRLRSPDAAPRVVSSFNLFQTPEPLAARLVSILGRSGRTLEPSAGLGRIYLAIRAADPSAPVTLVENSADCCRELYRAIESDGACRLVQSDFFTCSPASLGQFDVIAMNPPFKCGLDIKHIRHAMTFLAPGGRLASICANGPRQRAALQPIASEWVDLPAGSFKESFTNVAAAVFVYDRTA